MNLAIVVTFHVLGWGLALPVIVVSMAVMILTWNGVIVWP